MSRTATSTPAQTAKPAQAAMSAVATDKIAMLAYQKWLKAGCKHGCDKQHWYEAEAELKAQMTKK